MALKKINENPAIGDTILFEINTPGEDGCFTSDPFKVDKVVIFFIQRDFGSSNLKFSESVEFNQEKLADAEAAKKRACDDPTEENIREAEDKRLFAEDSSVTQRFFYTEAIPIANFGTELNPAWLSTDTENAILTKVEEDEDGNPLFGHFNLEWTPVGKGEGQFIVQWTWTPLAAGDKLCTYREFMIGGNTDYTVPNPTKRTQEGKYETLLEAYTPETLKMRLSDNDLTPQTINAFNKSVARGFTLLENLANGLYGLLDANSVPEEILPLMGNHFNLKLRTDDTTRWRRQIKRAIPLFKKKGTKEALEEALDQAGITLKNCDLLWQFISPYTWCEAFNVTQDGQTEFVLEKVPVLPIDLENFDIQLRPAGEDNFITLTSDYVTFSITDGVATMTWVGQSLSVNPIILTEGDTVKVLYEVNNVPNETQQALENYIRSLPLMDQRDDRDQEYPLKNWNVRLIDEDDVLFDVLIPTRHPYQSPVVFGTVRTEFPFGQNIYNMDEYDGSLRDSTEPCDIDKEFINCCSACQSSKFNLDIEIEEISNDRIIEAQQIINEYKPFHAQLNQLNFSALIDEVINCQMEEVEVLITYVIDETVLTGAQTIFSRFMEHGNVLPEDQPWGEGIKRELLSDLSIAATDIATLKAREVILFAPLENFITNTINNYVYESDPDAYVSGSNDNILEILAPHSNSGEYTVSGLIEKNAVRIDPGSPDTISESPLDSSEFTFNLSNIIYTNATNSVTPDNIFEFTDANINFAALGVKTDWDVDNDPTYTGGPWLIDIPAFSDSYTIHRILPDGTLLLNDMAGTLSEATDITYTLLDDVSASVQSSTTGAVNIEERAKVDVTDASVSDIRLLIETGDRVLFSGAEYEIIGFVEGELKSFYISEYSSGAAAGAIEIRRRVVTNGVGHAEHRGLILESTVDHEAGLGVVNGTSDDFEETGTGTDDAVSGSSTTSIVKENLLIMIESEYFAILEMDGTTITLTGPGQTWTTTGLAGRPFTIYKAEKQPLSVPDQNKQAIPDGHDFDYVDRRGKTIFNVEEEFGMSMLLRANALNAENNSQVIEYIKQEEEINVKIEYKDGSQEERQL
jgi:hypothetical protein